MQETSGADQDRGGFIGTSPVMLALYERIEKIATSLAPVFITGETGTGKTLCAQAIHHYGKLARKKFTALYCPYLSQQALEAALQEEGTVFLNGVEALTLPLQAVLREALPAAPCRLICAAHDNLDKNDGNTALRPDLFYRLHVLSIVMPPLRARHDDITDIARVFLLRFADMKGKRFRAFSDEAETLLRQAPWPGNIHQLKNTVRQAVVLHDDLIMTASMLCGPERITELPHPERLETSGASSPETITPLPLVARRAMEQAIRLCNGDIPRAAALLEISPSTLYRKKASWDGEML